MSKSNVLAKVWGDGKEHRNPALKECVGYNVRGAAYSKDQGHGLNKSRGGAELMAQKTDHQDSDEVAEHQVAPRHNRLECSRVSQQ
jgi:hypothetical protein